MPIVPPIASAGVLSLFLAAGLGGCIFDSRHPVAISRVQQPNISEDLDTLAPAGAHPDRIVELYQPFLDRTLRAGDSSAAVSYAPVNIKESDSAGTIVQYRLKRQNFGSWNPALEFKWNYFLLQSTFFFRDDLPDTAGMEGKTPALYDRIHAARDRFTRYYDSAAAPGVWSVITTSTNPGAIGVGVKLSPGRDTVLIQFVVAKSPAGRNGLTAGMAILEVNDSAITGADSAMPRFQRFATGDSGTVVKLRVLGPAGAVSYTLTREPVAFPTVMSDSLEGVGYISVNGFTPSTVESKSTYTEFRDALATTRRFPVTIIDLRQNGGGSLDVAIKMCDEILPGDGVIIRQRQRYFDELSRAPRVAEVSVLSTSGGTGENGADGKPRKYLLLGDTGSASASEIFLIAVKEGVGAPLMGHRTFGKGVGQTVRNSPGKGLALVTFLKFTSRKGLDYHGIGLEPDYPDSAQSDALLANAAARAKAMAGIAAMPSAKGTASAKTAAEARAALAARAAAIDWNRRQAVSVPWTGDEGVPWTGDEGL